MTGYSFQEGIHAGSVLDFERGIFSDPKHLHLQAQSGWHSFSILNDSNHKIVALVNFHIADYQAVSPFKSPYGSYIFSDDVSTQLLTDFILFVEQKLKEKGVKSTVLKNSPEVYRNNLLENVLLSMHYKIKNEETSAVISVTDNPLEEKLHRTKKSRLKKTEELGLAFKQLSLDHFDDVYAFLKAKREEKKYSLSMSSEDLKKVMETFPESFFLHAIQDKDALVATSISIQVEKHVLYTFYYDHAMEYDHVSPIVMLCDGLYGFCQQHQISLLDLGTSNIDGKLSESLLDFKVSLGAQPSRKLTFVKSLS